MELHRRGSERVQAVQFLCNYGFFNGKVTLFWGGRFRNGCL